MRHAFCSFGLVLAVLLALGSTCCETEWAEDIEDEAEDFGWYDEKPSPRIRIEEDPQENGIKKENTSAGDVFRSAFFMMPFLFIIIALLALASLSPFTFFSKNQ